MTNKALTSWIVLVIVLAASRLLGLPAQHGPEHSDIAHPSLTEPARPDPAKDEADKRFSEFNHRFAGIFVLLVGFLAVIEPSLGQRFGLVRYLWSLLFVIPGLYLFLFSDPEAWPVGPETLSYVITQDTQVLQHKIFSLLLLGLGGVEFLRVRRVLPSRWAAALFPALAASGALLLLFHSPQAHAAGMSPAAHLSMEKIHYQHIGFAVVGAGIVLSKALGDLGEFRPRLMRSLFALFMVSLGMLLVTYTE